VTKNLVKHRENLVKTKKTAGNRQNPKEDNPKLSVLGVAPPRIIQKAKTGKKGRGLTQALRLNIDKLGVP
jgi:hypothetical protein